MVSNAPLRILVDLNVILDVLAQRQPHYADSKHVWAAAETGKVQGLVDMLRVFAVAAVDQAVIQTALTLAWPDFEDAVQMAAAAQGNANYAVTHNPDDFKNGPVPVVSPANFIAVI
jgi:predicted nucleic acid-binding protein